jgi:hypothetical protein
MKIRTGFVARGRGAVPALALLAMVVVPPSGAVAQEARTADCVAAVVEGRPITLFDLRLVEAFGLLPAAAGGKDDPDPVRRRLDALIDQLAVLDLAREQVVPEPAEVDAALEEVRARLGAEAFARRLAELGLAEADLREVVAEKVRYARFVALRFGQAPAISLREIEAFYAETYAPERRREGAEPEPLIRVLDRIEARLRDEKRDALVAAWIRSVREQADVRTNEACLKSAAEKTPEDAP